MAAAVDRRWVESWTGDGDLSAPLNPLFLGALEEQLRLEVNNIDSIMVAEPLPGEPELPLSPVQDQAHPRLTRALRFRQDVRGWTAEGGLLLLGRGLAGRWEVTVEVDEGYRDAGLGRALARAARHLVPEQRPVWAQVAPGNAAGMRAFLAAGYSPVGAEALLAPRPA
ncbi:MAG TPA: GNAT family N-acetyltransferase [Actinoplanes sp.]